MSGAGGWSGWIAIALLPFSFWALIVAFLVVLFRSEVPLEAESEEEVTVVQPSRERSSLGWLPPVPQHHH
jgi:ABC-type uncharacterized transport system permease subunit